MGSRRHGLALGAALMATALGSCEASVEAPGVGRATAPLMTTTEKLVADDGAPGDELGFAVDVDGDTLVAGAHWADPAGSASGAAYVYVLGSSGWVQQQKLTPTSGGSTRYFGTDVAIEGNWIVVGEPRANGGAIQSGAIYMFERSGSTWTQRARLVAGTPRLNAQLGTSVDIDGDTVVAGAPGDPHTGSSAGTVWVFVNDGTGSWSQQAELRIASPDAGDELGTSVSLDGDDLIVGAPGDEARTFDITSGSVFVFTRSGTVWTQQARLIAPTSENYAEFGNSVAISGDTALIGAWLEDFSGTNAGGAYVFERSGTSWSYAQRLIGSDVISFDQFGGSVALEGGTAVLGAHRFDEGGMSEQGTAHVFLRGASWTEWDRIVGDTADEYDRMGYAVALRGDRVAVGAPGDMAGTTESSVGAVWVHDLVRLADGEACAYDPECQSGHCVDGVCCDTACGGGASDDCVACATSAGAAADGTCGPLSSAVAPTVTCRPAAGGCDVAESCVAGDPTCPADAVEPSTTVCRAVAGGCDVEELCDGSSAACPADAVEPTTTVCRASAGDCDVEETCDGTTVDCPADAVEPTTTVCRASAGDCDVEETCDGATVDCPADAVEPSTTVCRPAADSCDAPESCDGSGVGCPSDVDAADGTACPDGVTCNGDEVCAAGSCVAGDALDCDDGDPCTADMCAEPAGCAHEAIDGCCVDDAGCDDGDACTTDACNTDANTCSHEPITGCEPDAGTPDAGTPDAGPSDAGTTDAGLDAGPGGAADAAIGPVRERGGCGCRVTSPAEPGAWRWAGLAVLVPLLLRRSRRRQRVAARPPGRTP